MPVIGQGNPPLARSTPQDWRHALFRGDGLPRPEHDRNRNLILAAVSPADWSLIAAEFRPVHLERQRLLFEPDAVIDRLYFPLSAVISAVAVFEDGSVAEMAITGREGMAEFAAILGSRTCLSRHLVQVAGDAFEISHESFHRMARKARSFAHALRAFAQAYVGQAGQLAACNSVHSVERRAARWLLMCRDRTDEDSFPMTQEFLAEMLGVSRLSVGTVARALQRAGLIRYNRGQIEILDRAGLESVACECYRIIAHHFENRLLRLSSGAAVAGSNP